jgi:hypothetical protein
MRIGERVGTNPYKFGMIGSTDSHTGLATAQEDNFFGKHSGAEPGPERYKHPMAALNDMKLESWDMVASGLAGVWAEENTRASIWDAMKRRETFATSGPRIKVRMFGSASLSAPPDPGKLVQHGYSQGVPMGGDLPAGMDSPSFTVYAEKDPMGANLDRIQIIKGWVDKDGVMHEKIIEVVWAGKRKLGPDGKLPPVGSTVNLKTATYSNDIGATLLTGSWLDNEFNPAAPAFYYARVLEIPTPRWSTYESVRNSLPLLPEVAAVIQERAWGSPIWYSP